MRNILILIIFVAAIVCISCSANNPKTDVKTDADSGVESDVNDTDTTSNISTDPDVTDIDIQDESPDIDTVVECLDLRYNENTLKTGFPFKDKDGKPTFCRPGCDTPTETDPQCVRNIWEWDNWEKYQEYLKAEKEDPDQNSKRECYPWPCKLPEMASETLEVYTSKCDRHLTSNNFQSNSGGVWTHGMSDGVAGMNFGSRSIEYDPVKDEYIVLGKTASMLSYNQNRYILSVFDSFAPENPDYSSYVVSVQRKNGEFFYELIYDTETHKAFMSNPSIAGDKWVLIQIRPGKGSSVTDVKYAKAGEWEWHSLGLGKIYEGNIVGDHLTFLVAGTNPDKQIYYCDLSKYPESYQDCYKVTDKLESGEAEMGSSPRIDEENESRLVYKVYNESGGIIKEVIFKDGIPSETYKHTVGISCAPTKVVGSTMSFSTPSTTSSSILGCFYRFDKEKVYCPSKPWSENGTENMEFSIFDGKWQLWRGSALSHIRDWECYCTETGVCPFEE